MGLVEFRSLEDKLHPCSNAILSANKYIRKMKGGSQSILVRANDGKHYVVKMTDNPVGPNVLANESMGSTIAKAVGLPVAEAKGIVISDSFIDSHPDLWFELESGKRRPNKGVHFGSLLVGQTSGTERPTEYVSPSRVHLITNREAFLGMYILDIWANQQDNRQAVFRRRPDNTQEAFFIDHGHMFGGPEWNFNNTSHSALHLELELYRDLWQEDKITSWISHFQTIVPEVLRRLDDPIDSKWYSGDLAALIDRLTKRLAELPELVQTDLVRISRLFPRNRINEDSATIKFRNTQHRRVPGHGIFLIVVVQLHELHARDFQERWRVGILGSICASVSRSCSCESLDADAGDALTTRGFSSWLEHFDNLI